MSFTTEAKEHTFFLSKFVWFPNAFLVQEKKTGISLICSRWNLTLTL